MSRRPRRLVVAARLLALLEHALDGARADHHAEAVDRGVLRQREGVDRLDAVVEGVGEGLGHVRGDEVAGDLQVDVGVLEREGAELLAVGADGDEDAGAGRLGLRGIGEAPAGEEGQREQGDEQEQGDEREGATHGGVPPAAGMSNRRARVATQEFRGVASRRGRPDTGAVSD